MFNKSYIGLLKGGFVLVWDGVPIFQPETDSV